MTANLLVPVAVGLVGDDDAPPDFIWPDVHAAAAKKGTTLTGDWKRCSPDTQIKLDAWTAVKDINIALYAFYTT